MCRLLLVRFGPCLFDGFECALLDSGKWLVPVNQNDVGLGVLFVRQLENGELTAYKV